MFSSSFVFVDAASDTLSSSEAMIVRIIVGISRGRPPQFTPDLEPRRLQSPRALVAACALIGASELVRRQQQARFGVRDPVDEANAAQHTIHGFEAVGAQLGHDVPAA